MHTTNYNSCGVGVSMAAFLVIEVSSQGCVILIYYVPILWLTTTELHGTSPGIFVTSLCLHI